MNDDLQSKLRRQGWIFRDGEWFAPSRADRVASDPVVQSNPVHDVAPADEGETVDQVRRFVRVTSFRVKLCDERNLWDKHFIDALVEAGILIDDSPEWAKIEVSQEQVNDKALERTVLEIELL